MATTPVADQMPWYMKSTFPVMFPTHEGFDLTVSQSAFDALIKHNVRAASTQKDDKEEANDEMSNKDDNFTIVSETTLQDMQDSLVQLDMTTTAEVASEVTSDTESERPKERRSEHPFIQGLLSYEKATAVPLDGNTENKMLTENNDVAYRSTKSHIVDLFVELEDVVSGPRLCHLLNAAWEQDSLATLKIIFNARSIHLGKASRTTFYRCAGWLAENHPLTLISNLRWLSRPVIPKKVSGKETDELDFDAVMVDVKSDMNVEDFTQFDVKYGVSHGYWKDLLNILVLGVCGQLKGLTQPNDVLYVEKSTEARGLGREENVRVSREEAKTRRHDTREVRHSKAIAAFNTNSVYQGLYVTVARLFAEQLKKDLALLRGDDPKAKENISLCAKWAPSHDRFHDKHTFIVSTIAEILHPTAKPFQCHDKKDREAYLRRAREEYRKDLSELRAHLDIVERKLSAKKYNEIHYERVPSLAMKSYSKIFAQKDTERFDQYLDDVANNKIRISGATLLPSAMIKPFRQRAPWNSRRDNAVIAERVANGQWKTLVQRIKDSGTLESSIAVCDVSGSMNGPQFSDGTCPMDSAIGLSLLLAEVTAPPFGGHFITFSANPKMESIDPSQSLSEKVDQLISNSDWNMNTNFVAVFEQLILPMAIRNKLSQEDMVKRVFVFSDMQFDEAEQSTDRFSSSFERIKRSYENAGYQMPELVFWNLAGGRAGYELEAYGDPTAPKPVTAEETGTAIVSGYSQAMLKVFLDNGSFAEEEEDDITTAEDDDTVVVDSQTPAKKRRLNPMDLVRKAISHMGYDSLAVLD